LTDLGNDWLPSQSLLGEAAFWRSREATSSPGNPECGPSEIGGRLCS